MSLLQSSSSIKPNQYITIPGPNLHLRIKLKLLTKICHVSGSLIVNNILTQSTQTRNLRKSFLRLKHMQYFLSLNTRNIRIFLTNESSIYFVSVFYFQIHAYKSFFHTFRSYFQRFYVNLAIILPQIMSRVKHFSRKIILKTIVYEFKKNISIVFT